MTARDEFLRQVRQAVAEGNRAGGAAPLEPRGAVGYQGAGPDAVARFRDEFAAAGGQTCVVPDRRAAAAAVLALLQQRGARRVLLGRGRCVDTLGLEEALQDLGVEVLPAEGGGSVPGGVIRTRTGNVLAPGEQRGAFFAADVGVSGVDYLVAETGSLALLSGPGQPRSLSLLPPVHVAVAERAQLLHDLFDLFEARLWAERQGLPSCLSLITGPSKTGDIELRLVTGVHGPGEVHVVLIDPGGPPPGSPTA
jgi:L-lactate utilization protein LutC